MPRGGRIVKYTAAENKRIIAAELAELAVIAKELGRPLRAVKAHHYDLRTRSGQHSLRPYAPDDQPTPRPRRQRDERHKIKTEPVARSTATNRLARPDWFDEKIDITAGR